MKKNVLNFRQQTAGKIFKNICITLLILLLCFCFSLVMQSVKTLNASLIPALFVLAVFLTSVLTEGYIYGISAALLSVLAVNFAFTFPFFAFDFTVPENLISGIILLIVTVITCGLTTKVKRQEAIKAESEKERMRANLLRAVSHDLRTPLTTIYGASSALLDNSSSFTEAQRKQMLQNISEDAEWLSRMVENLLSVTRVDGSNLEILKTETALDELVDSVLIKFSKRYPNQQVDVDIPEDFVLIPMDAMLIEQVLINLLENAVQHAAGMTRLYLRVKVTENKATFEIEDNGCGLSEEHRKNIFTGCYTQATALSDRKQRHAGIGLSVCASIVRAHGGTIWAQKAQKSGCIFGFTLNLEVPHDHKQ